MITVELMDVLSTAKKTGVLGWLKIKDASKIVSNSSGTYSINPTIYIQNYVQKEDGDEIVMFGKKQLNITKLEKDLKKYIGMDVNFFIGGISFSGILLNTTIETIKKDLNIDNSDIAEMFDYKNTNSFATSSAYKRILNGLVDFYKLTKKVSEEKIKEKY